MAEIIEFFKVNKELYKEIYVLNKDYNVIYGYIKELLNYKCEVLWK